jgi:hypothetical protein
MKQNLIKIFSTFILCCLLVDWWNASPVAVSCGGTGSTSASTAFGIACGGTTSTGAIQYLSSFGTSTQNLVSAGAAALPTWQTCLPGNTAAGNFAYAGSTTALGASPARTLLISPTSYASITNSAVDNTAFGFNALNGVTSNTQCTAIGGRTLTSCTANNNTAVGDQCLTSCTSGTENVGVGVNNLQSGTTGISFNVAVGNSNLNASTSGSQNVAIGHHACFTGVGSNNTALGYQIMDFGSTNASNSCFGFQHISTSGGGTASSHSSVGYNALAAVTGNNDVAIGSGAGSTATSGSNNLYIGYNAVVISATESNTIVIGNSSHTVAYFFGSRTGLAGASNVLVNASSKLGTTTSARRFKENIMPVDTLTVKKLMDINVVQFFYKDDACKTLQYGMIAQDMVSIFPETVVYDVHGSLYSIQYHKFIPLLLKQMQLEKQRIAAIKKRIRYLKNKLKICK